MNPKTLILLSLLSAPAMAQQVYKCPQPEGPPKFQQQPCTITGEGEKIQVNAPSPGDGGLRDSERIYLEERDKARQQQSPPARSASVQSDEVQKECFTMRRRIVEMQNRESRGIHSWSRTGIEESTYRKQEYETLCGAW